MASLREASNAVLIAPPGAGKTTAVAPALLNEPWCTATILLLSPRRLAARAAAERMAELAGEAVGGTFGYATRMDSKRSSSTRILVLTEGIFRNQIQNDPELRGICAVLFDEVHERSLDSDFGLALALDAQSALRPDLRLIAMSATLDGTRFADLMNARVIESEGRSHPLTLYHVGRRAEARIEDEMADVIRRALAEQGEGSCLAFLPGVAEIERVAERLDRLPADVNLLRLHGSLDASEQRNAIAAPPPGTRNLILATSIAETSLTLNGVSIVVDSGLARRPRYDRAAGMTRLVTERASQAAVTQRAGRAARQRPGVAYRLWEEAATAGMPRFDPPEILEADLSSLVLDCTIWGVSDPATLGWIDPPPRAAIDEARIRLASLGAIDVDGRPTGHGRKIAKLPLAPRLGHMLIASEPLGLSVIAADAAVLLSERGLGGNDPDLDQRRTRWGRERGKRAIAARNLSRRWAHMAQHDAPPPAHDEGRYLGVGGAIALAFPDRIARRRGTSGEHWASVGGRGFKLDPTSTLARSEWLAVAETQGAATGARIISAAAISWPEIEALYGARIVQTRSIDFDLTTRSASARIERRLGALTIASGHDANADPVQVSAALVAAVRTHGVDLLDWNHAASALRERAHFAGVIDIDDQKLVERAEEWLPPLVAGKRKLGDISQNALFSALEALLDWPARQTIEARAPAEFVAPAGTRHAIDYAADGGPQVELRVQALYGLAVHPVVGRDRIALTLSLTSPAGRPIQTTRDLPGFWAGSWLDVAKDMRGEYPRHNWPDDPASAVASLKTKRAQMRSIRP